MVWVEVYGGQGSLALYVLYITDLKRGTQRPNVSKYVRIVSNGFLYALEASLVNLELPLKPFIWSDVLRELWPYRKFKVSFSS